MRNIREVKVGDIVVASGIEHLVLGVAGELFGYSTSFGKYFYGWMSFEQAEELGWHIKEEKVDGVDDSEEFTKEELNFLKNVIIATPTRDDETGHYLGGIYHKLNKMLNKSK